MIMQRTRIMPQFGKGPEVRAQLTDWAKHGQSQGRQIALGQRLFSTEGQAFVIVTLADDFSEPYGELRAARQLRLRRSHRAQRVLLAGSLS